MWQKKQQNTKKQFSWDLRPTGHFLDEGKIKKDWLPTGSSLFNIKSPLLQYLFSFLLFGTFSLVFCLYFVPGDTLWCVDNVSGISLCQCRGQPWPSWNGWHWRKLCLLSIAASAIVHSLPKKCTLKSSWRKTRYLSCTMVCRCI